MDSRQRSTATDNRQATTPAKPRVCVVSRSVRVSRALCERVPRGEYDLSVVQPGAAAPGRDGVPDVDAVIYHLQGSGAGAFELLDRLRRRECDACVILAGRDYGAELVAGLLRAGAYDYVTLPVRPGRLEESLQQGLEIRRAFLRVRELSGQLKAANDALAHERDSLRRLNRNLVLLNRLGQAVSGTLNADEIVGMVGNHLGDILDFDLAGVVWSHPPRVWLHAAAEVDQGVIERTRQALLTRERGLVPSVGSGQAVRVVEEPLVVAKNTVGCLRVERLQGQPFEAYHIELVKAVATSLALALRNAEAHGQVQNMAMTDGLTNVLNRRAFSNALARQFEDTRRYGTPLCLVMADIDRFKAFNDRFGHVQGDLALQAVASLISQATRAGDIVARYGGEEFAIVLPHTDVQQATALANRIRETIERHEFGVNGSRVSTTVSMGVAQIPDPCIATVDELVAAADSALYEAKRRGRNRVEVYAPAAGRPATVFQCGIEAAGVGEPGRRR